MTHQELEYLRICTQSHKRDLVLVKTKLRYSNDTKESIVRMLTRIENAINLMYITLEAEANSTQTEVKDND